jgi:triosephosphate isomerase (TIM)
LLAGMGRLYAILCAERSVSVDPRRIPLVAGNWKMHHAGGRGVELAVQVARAAAHVPGVEVLVAPPFLAIPGVISESVEVARQLGIGAIGVAGQNLHPEPKGAFTGEISGPMLAEAGARAVIVGHSERRQYFAEDDALVARKTKAAIDAGLMPIVCVGETLEERESGRTLEVVLRMVDAVLDVMAAAGGRAVVAYEPVWAIGTGKVATPGDAQDVHAAIRQRLGALAGPTRILYGGSVKPDNARELLAQPDIDGALVGGASLDIEQFGPILRAAHGLL